MLLVAACGPARPTPSAGSSGAGADTCAVRLAPRPAPAAVSASAPPPAPPSTLVVHAEVPLASVRQNLETKVGRRVAEERDHDIGAAGRLEYTVDRGPFAASVQGDALVIETPLVGHARACAKGRCYAGCDPQMKAVARVPLRLSAEYRFRPSSVRIDVVRGCEVRALGGLVTVDATPALRGRLAQEAKRIEQSIDRELPDLRPQAERLWAELAKARPLPLGACVVVQPEGIVQGAPGGAGDLARLRFGLVARPEVRARCGEPPRAAPLPPLRDERDLPEAGDVDLAVVLAPEAPAIALEGELGELTLGPRRARARRVTGPATSLAVELGGDVCGEVALGAGSAAWVDDARVHLAGVSLRAGEPERAAAAGVDLAAAAPKVEAATIPVGIGPTEVRTLGPDLARGLSDDRVTVTAAVSAASRGPAYVRGSEVVAVVRARGALTVRPK